MQALKQKTVQKTMVSTQTSQKLVQTMLDASLGCIAYLRGILPDDDFVEERYNAIDLDPKSKSKGKHGTDQARSGQRIMRLRHNASKEARQLLDYLEKGVYHALGKRYLASIMLSISIDPADANNIHECYTFQLTYGDSPEPSIRVTNKQSSKSTDTLPLDLAKQHIQQLFRQLIVLTQSLAPLPDVAKYLSIRLYYTSDTPEDYEPPGFRAAGSGDAARFVTHLEAERPHDQALSSVDTAHHKMTMHLATVADLSNSQVETDTTEHVRVWDAEHHAKVAARGEVDEDTTMREIVPLTNEAIKVLLQDVQTPRARVRDDVAQYLDPQTNSEVPSTLELPRTQSPVSQMQTRSQRARQRSAEADLSDKLTSVSIGSKKNADPPVKAVEEEEVSRCECGENDERGMMVRCEDCGSWQHLHCYGFWNGDPHNYIHTCFTCRHVDNPALLATMSELTLLRKAIRHLWDQKSPENANAFAKAMETSSERSDAIISKLVRDGWVDFSGDSGPQTRHRGGRFAAKSKPVFSIIKSTENDARRKTIFDPAYDLTKPAPPTPVLTSSTHNIPRAATKSKTGIKVQQQQQQPQPQPQQQQQKQKRARSSSPPGDSEDEGLSVRRKPTPRTLARQEEIPVTPATARRRSTRLSTSLSAGVSTPAPAHKRASTTTGGYDRETPRRSKRLKVSITREPVVAEPLPL